MSQRELKKWLAERGANTPEMITFTLITEVIELRQRVDELERVPTAPAKKRRLFRN